MNPTPEVLRGWGMVNRSRSWVYRPRHEAEVAEALVDARRRGLTVAHRGAGLSYGDAALNQGGAVMAFEGLDRILGVDPAKGTVRAQAGVSIEALWKATLPRGLWPPVVPGSMKVTLGGAVAMNIHGKNQRVKGSFGEHVVGLSVVRADGTLERLGPGSGAPSGDGGMAGIVGALGLNGSIVDVTLRLQRVHSGHLEVESWSTGSLEESLAVLDERATTADYAVGWIDCFPAGRRSGRGLLHFARHLPADHPLAGEALTPEAQRLPSRILGVLPRHHAWRLLRALTHDPGVRAVNLGRSWSGRLRHGRRYRQTHAAFHFLLDYMPGWKRVYAPHGLIQYQLFVPRGDALPAYREALRLQRALGVVSYLAVLKSHRADSFPSSYSVDGFSLALDFPVRPDRLRSLRRLCRSYDDLLRDVGGRIYAAKDAVSRGRLPRDRHPAYSSNLVRRWERPGDRVGA
ncbi:MAG TPA: FAD-binding oxidoreductase [Longimicrobiales bacterium]|nr:FAD-binding oxidoreductase [Longimicrobiales bacterium]